jgi:hypothetical protein
MANEKEKQHGPSSGPQRPKQEALMALAVSLLGDPLLESAKNDVRDALTKDPIESAMMAILVGSYAFFQAENGINPKVQTFGDALVFISTSMSVGYSDIFPKTERGKIIASAIQTFGPAMTARLLDPPRKQEEDEKRAAAETQQQILQRLDAILDALKSRPL